MASVPFPVRWSGGQQIDFGAPTPYPDTGYIKHLVDVVTQPAICSASAIQHTPANSTSLANELIASPISVRSPKEPHASASGITYLPYFFRMGTADIDDGQDPHFHSTATTYTELLNKIATASTLVANPTLNLSYPSMEIYCAWTSGVGFPGPFLWQGSAPVVRMVSAGYSQSSGSVTYTASWWTTDFFVDSTLTQEGIKWARMIVDSTEHDMTMTVTELDSRTEDMGEMDGTVLAGNYMEFAEVSGMWKVYLCEGEVTVSQTEGDVQFQLYHDTYGLNYFAVDSHLTPVAAVALSYAEPTLTADASGSYSNDSPIDTYEFTVRNADTLATIYNVTQAGNTLNLSAIESLLDDDTDVDVVVEVVTDYGCEDDDTDGPVTIEVPHRTDAADLPSKAHYVFYRAGADLKLSFYSEGQSTRTVVATFANCSQPSFWVKSDSSFRAAMDNLTGFILKSSYDRGATWSSSLATIWSSATYNKAASCGLLNGGAASVAMKKSTSPAQVWVKVTPDETDWSGAAVMVDTTTSAATQFSIRQKQASGSAKLVISNGTDEIWESIDAGLTWVAI